MKRAIWLICTLTLLCVAAGVWTDSAQSGTARRYMAQLPALRALVQAEDFPTALERQSELHALWQGDALWLNKIVSHHHTRAVDGALLSLATALEEGWRTEALQALDALYGALGEITSSDSFLLENIL